MSIGKTVAHVLDLHSYRSIAELQQDLNLWLQYYNQQRTHSGKYCFGKTPMQTLIDSIPLAKEKLLESLAQNQSFFPFLSLNNTRPRCQVEIQMKIGYLHSTR
jgi:hypothetical protein